MSPLDSLKLFATNFEISDSATLEKIKSIKNSDGKITKIARSLMEQKDIPVERHINNSFKHHPFIWIKSWLHEKFRNNYKLNLEECKNTVKKMITEIEMKQKIDQFNKPSSDRKALKEELKKYKNEQPSIQSLKYEISKISGYNAYNIKIEKFIEDEIIDTKEKADFFDKQTKPNPGIINTNSIRLKELESQLLRVKILEGKIQMLEKIDKIEKSN